MDFQEKIRAYKRDPNPVLFEKLKKEATRLGIKAYIRFLLDFNIRPDSEDLEKLKKDTIMENEAEMFIAVLFELGDLKLNRLLTKKVDKHKYKLVIKCNNADTRRAFLDYLIIHYGKIVSYYGKEDYILENNEGAANLGFKNGTYIGLHNWSPMLRRSKINFTMVIIGYSYILTDPILSAMIESL